MISNDFGIFLGASWLVNDVEAEVVGGIVEGDDLGSLLEGSWLVDDVDTEAIEGDIVGCEAIGI